VPLHRAVRGGAASIAAALVVVVTSQAFSIDVRACVALFYLPIGYWLPAFLTPAPHDSRFERWLRRHDIAWRRAVGSLPAAAAALLDLAYLACYLVVPLAFVIVWSAGTLQQVDRFWTAVLLSGFACYITLPWLVSRPPRIVDRDHAPPARASLASFNVSLLRRVSHDLNTFPSGHVAVATAVALTVFPVSRGAGIAFGIAAIGIAVGAAVGRYHYGVDVLLGALVGVAAATLAT
jgi:membrane-associated phospholipid phosphatase